MSKNEAETETTTTTDSTANAAETVPSDNSELARVRREIDAAITASKPKADEKPEDEEKSPDSEVGSIGETEDEAAEDGPPEVEDEAPSEGGPQGRDASGKFTKRAPFSDALLERAIKAGLPMSEAREYPTEALLKSVVDRLEGFQKNATGETKSADAKREEGEAKPADDLEAAINAIPEEWNKEEYDERLVGALLALKKIAKTQLEREQTLAKELADLRGKESKDAFAKQLESVKDLVKGDQTKESAIREEYDALKAGYAASGKEVPEAEVFQKAARLVLGGEMQAKAEAEAKKNKTEAAGKRNGQILSRAAGQRVTAKTADPFARVAEWVDQKLASR